MGMMDDMKDKAQDAMGDKDKQDKIKQLADQHGISLEEAKQRFADKNG